MAAAGHSSPPYTNTVSLWAFQNYTNIRFHQIPFCPTHTYAHTRAHRLLNGQRRPNMSQSEMSGLITQAFQQSSTVRQHPSHHTDSQMWIKKRNRLTIIRVNCITFQINALKITRTMHSLFENRCCKHQALPQ